MRFRRASLISVISLIVFLFVGEVNSPLYNGFLAFALLALGNMNFKFDVPDLSQLRELGTVFAARRAFQGAGPTDYKARALTINYLRLVDTAIREYENGRSTLSRLEEVTNGGLNLITRASSHFETCIDALRRCLNHLKKIKAHEHTPRSMTALLPRGLQVLKGKTVQKIVNMRTRIQHLERDIVKGQIVIGQPICLMPKEDGLELGDYRIHFIDLAKC